MSSKFLPKKNNNKSTTNGFSLIELLVVAFLIGVISSFLLINLRVSSRNRGAVERNAQVFVSDVRRAQAMALSGSKFEGAIVCGYGIHFVSTTSYIIYVGLSGGGTCALANKYYEAGIDRIFATFLIDALNNNMEFKDSFGDVFFEPPDPKTYLCSITTPITCDSTLSASPLSITIGLKGGICPNDCKTVTINTGGLID